MTYVSTLYGGRQLTLGIFVKKIYAWNPKGVAATTFKVKTWHQLCSLDLSINSSQIPTPTQKQPLLWTAKRSVYYLSAILSAYNFYYFLSFHSTIQQPLKEITVFAWIKDPPSDRYINIFSTWYIHVILESMRNLVILAFIFNLPYNLEVSFALSLGALLNV